MSSSDSDEDHFSIFSDDFLHNNQISEEPDPDIGYLLQHTPKRFSDSFFVPWVQSPDTPIPVHSHSVPTITSVPSNSVPIPVSTRQVKYQSFNCQWKS